MTAELVPVQPTEIQRQSTMQDTAVNRLGEWAQSALAAHQVAEGLVQTAFVPEAFRGKPHEATAAILAGAEVGLSPLAALRSFDIINGTAAARAITLRAIVQSQGHEIVLTESTATRCKMRGRRRGDNTWQEVTWTMDRAKNLGLTNKHNWKAQPQAMLVARATSELCRLVAADAILGIGLSVEEVQDGDTPDQPTELPAEPSTGGTRRMSRPEKKAEPKPVPSAVRPEGPEREPITDKQLQKLHILFGEVGIKDRDEGLRYLSELTGRTIGSSKELTKDEASRAIDTLEQRRNETSPEPADG